MATDQKKSAAEQKSSPKKTTQKKTGLHNASTINTTKKEKITTSNQKKAKEIQRLEQQVKKLEQQASNIAQSNTQTIKNSTIYSKKADKTNIAGFSVTKITALEKKSNKKVPNWILLMFIFSLVLLLFAFYKITLQANHINTHEGNFLPNQQDQQTETALNTSTTPGFKENVPHLDDVVEHYLEVIEIDTEIPSPEQSSMQADYQIIEDFYAALGQVDIHGLNFHVDLGLKNTSIWQQFWSYNNINTFISNIHDTLRIENLFFIADSNNNTKQTRQYSYELSYILNSNQEFKEEWIITLRDTQQGTKIAEIFCETKKCSSSPFFWPQNYGLK